MATNENGLFELHEDLEASILTDSAVLNRVLSLARDTGRLVIRAADGTLFKFNSGDFLAVAALGAAGGVASLDGSSKVPPAQLPGDLGTLAGLSTTSFGRGLLTVADAPSMRTLLSVPSTSDLSGYLSATNPNFSGTLAQGGTVVVDGTRKGFLTGLRLTGYTTNALLKTNSSGDVSSTAISDNGTTITLGRASQVSGSLGVAGDLTATQDVLATRYATASQGLKALLGKSDVVRAGSFMELSDYAESANTGWLAQLGASNTLDLWQWGPAPGSGDANWSRMFQFKSTGLEFNGLPYMTSNQTITLSGDVSGTGSTSIAVTIPLGTVSLAKMANFAANSIMGNNTGTPVAPLALSPAQVKTMLAIAYTDVSGISATAPITYSGGVIAHATTDGNHHVPATGTSSAGKLLMAGALAGSEAWTAMSGDAIISSGGVLTLASVITAGSAGSGTAIPVLVYDTKGRLTSVTTTPNTPAWASITGKPTTVSGYGITDILSQTLGTLTLVNSAIVAGDTVQAAFGKAQGQVNAINTTLGGLLTSANPAFTGTLTGPAATFSGVLTISAQTANAVAFLDASKILTANGKMTWNGVQLGLGTVSGLRIATPTLYLQQDPGTEGGAEFKMSAAGGSGGVDAASCKIILHGTHRFQQATNNEFAFKRFRSGDSTWQTIFKTTDPDTDGDTGLTFAGVVSVMNVLKVQTSATTTSFLWTTATNEKTSFLGSPSTANDGTGYHSLVLHSNDSETSERVLGYIHFGQKVAGKSGTNAGLKANIRCVTTGGGGSVGGYGGQLVLAARASNGATLTDVLSLDTAAATLGSGLALKQAANTRIAADGTGKFPAVEVQDPTVVTRSSLSVDALGIAKITSLGSTGSVNDVLLQWGNSSSADDILFSSSRIVKGATFQGLVAVRGASFTWNDATEPSQHLKTTATMTITLPAPSSQYAGRRRFVTSTGAYTLTFSCSTNIYYVARSVSVWSSASPVNIQMHSAGQQYMLDVFCDGDAWYIIF